LQQSQIVNAVRAQEVNFSVSDRNIDAAIDPGISPERRDYVRRAMLELPPSERYYVAGYDSSGRFFSNHLADYGEVSTLRSQSQTDWKASAGNAAPVDARPDFLGLTPCPPPSDNHGPFVRGYICNSPYSSFTATVDTSDIQPGTGTLGNHWCLQADDYAYILVGAWNESGLSAEGGFQWSPTLGVMELYFLSTQASTEPIPASYHFPSGPYTLTLQEANGVDVLVVGSVSGVPKTWEWPAKSNVLSGNLFTYKTLVSISQQVYNPDGSYFGIDESGAPTIMITPQVPLTQYQQYPNASFALKSGDFEGVYFHQ